jgi:hypothetical protein
MESSGTLEDSTRTHMPYAWPFPSRGEVCLWAGGLAAYPNVALVPSRAPVCGRRRRAVPPTLLSLNSHRNPSRRDNSPQRKEA